MLHNVVLGFNANLPGSKRRESLYFLATASWLDWGVSAHSRIWATTSLVIRFIDRCHEVEPVPVLIHRPELFTFVFSPSGGSLISKYETWADKLSPTNTYNSQNIRVIFVQHRTMESAYTIVIKYSKTLLIWTQLVRTLLDFGQPFREKSLNNLATRQS